MNKSLHKFPSGFLWGTATAAHQIEGNNKNTDWWLWENRSRNGDDAWPLEPSGIAADSFNRYEEDFELCRILNNNAVRISIEWARIEPVQGTFDESAINHYRKVLESARAKNLKTFVTLHHFTNPVWFSEIGGWENFGAPQLFANYAEKCASEFGDLVDAFCTINEPQVLIFMGYYNGIWPPNKKNIPVAFWVQYNLIKAHRVAYDSIKKILPEAQVGIVKHVVWQDASGNGWFPAIDAIWARLQLFWKVDSLILPLGKKNDFIGANFYFTERSKNLRQSNANDWLSDLGWWIYPKGLENILVYLKKYNVPIYITENGLADSKDVSRKKFLHDMLASVHAAIEKGAGIKGYFYWSLIDNYEWHQGYWPRFGLVEIDRENGLARKPRPSFYYYAQICKDNELKSLD